MKKPDCFLSKGGDNNTSVMRILEKSKYKKYFKVYKY